MPLVEMGDTPQLRAFAARPKGKLPIALRILTASLATPRCAAPAATRALNPLPLVVESRISPTGD
ncbi:MAG: hypothetical protein HY271_16705 [Deltaproteobacteria bacterium]|nr:hypothetical protein [Deltaproteobacteria bacterium]